jgi:hypothetical protein
MSTKGIVAATTAALALALPASAHHSIGMIEIGSPVWIKGTVASFRAMHPHVTITLDVTGPGGRSQRWTVEGPNLMRLARMQADENFLKAGDAIEVCGFPLKSSVLTYRWPEGGDGARSHFVHGHLLVMPDGHRRLFGPYGKLDNCVRTGDIARTWLDFLAADPLGKQAWCSGLTYARVPSVAPAALVDDVNRGLTEPCR